MVLKSTPGANIPVYQIAGGNQSRSLPDWLIRKRKQSLKNDPDFANRVTLIQDFEFDEASNRIKLTRDGQYAMVTGVYKPQIHVYDFNQLSLKFDRHTAAENVDFAIISDDWTKSVHLQTDRAIEFQTPGGVHHITRIPKFGRSLAYNRANCDLLVGASSNEVYRLNLDQGRFLAPFETDSDGINVVQISPAHGLIGCGGENGTVEFWDYRSRNRVAVLPIGGNEGVIGSGVTALAFHDNGLQMAAGTYEGNTLLFDLRSNQPLVTKDQGYGFPIKNIGFLQAPTLTDKIYTADKRIIKIWDTKNGSPFTSIEPNVDINDVAHVPDSGMFLLANEGIPMHAYYVPAVGPAPKWCSFLDSITEELEERPATTVYENYRFVTRKELQNLNLGHLIGSNVVKSYMHGYFIDQRLYDQAKLISNPFEYREHREKEIRKRIEKERESRIRTGPKVKVNKDFAQDHKEKLDSRFKAMFEDADFEIDTNSYEYKLLHGGRADKSRERLEPRALTAAEEEQMDVEEEQSSSSDSEADSKKKDRKNRLKERKARRRLEEQPSMTAVEINDKSDLAFGDQVVEDKPSKSKEDRGPAVRGETEFSYIPRSKPKKHTHRPDSGRSKPRLSGTLRKANKSAFRGM